MEWREKRKKEEGRKRTGIRNKNCWEQVGRRKFVEGTVHKEERMYTRVKEW